MDSDTRVGDIGEEILELVVELQFSLIPKVQDGHGSERLADGGNLKEVVGMQGLIGRHILHPKASLVDNVALSGNQYAAIEMGAPVEMLIMLGNLISPVDEFGGSGVELSFREGDHLVLLLLLSCISLAFRASCHPQDGDEKERDDEKAMSAVQD